MVKKDKPSVPRPEEVYDSGNEPSDEDELCDAPKPGGPLTTRQPAEYKWRSSYPTPLQKIGQNLLCTRSSTQIQNLHILSQTTQYICNIYKYG